MGKLRKAKKPCSCEIFNPSVCKPNFNDKIEEPNFNDKIEELRLS